MWFSSDRSDRPRRRPSHATVVAYLALIVSVVGGTGAAVAAGLVHTRNIANGAVTAPKIRNNAVHAPKIHNNAVTAPKIRNGAVTNPKIHNDAVGTGKIRNGAVTHPKIANNAVGSHQIRNGAVDRPKIRDGAITGAKVANHSLTGQQINVSTLPLTGGPEHFNNAREVTAGSSTPVPLEDVTGLGPGAYSQPAHSLDIVTGLFGVELPDTGTTGCAAGSPVLFRVVVRGVNHRIAAEGTITLPAWNNSGLQTSAPIAAVDPTVTTNPTSGSVTRTLTAHVSAFCTDADGGFHRPVGATLVDLSLRVTRTRGAVHPWDVRRGADGR